ncbi:hypothetical protein [Paenibacillus pabuli]|uniref:hypothetical protein n=1 Tax=Paenibacillus pabuli TaxID=1472 RepID=UPI001FFE5848|nr:hypothetical protein [Paenibacillus pabuli]
MKLTYDEISQILIALQVRIEHYEESIKQHDRSSFTPNFNYKDALTAAQSARVKVLNHSWSLDRFDKS